MVNFPFKALIFSLQVRTLVTKTSKFVVESTLKPVITTSDVLKPKTQKNDEIILLEREESVIALLKKQHFSDAQIARLVQENPKILRCKVKTTLEPKFRFLIENGFVGSFLTEVIVKNPLILRRSLNGHLIPNVEYLRTLVNNDQAVVLTMVKRSSWILTLDLRKICQPNIDLLLKEGVKLSNVLKLFATQPRTCFVTTDKIRYGVEISKKFGLNPSENMFIHALRVVLSMTESTFNKKIDFLKSLGWSDEDITSTMAHHPFCLSQSEDKLRSTFEFYVNTMHLKPKYLMRYPKLLMYSLDKRIIPRCNLIIALKERKLIKDLGISGLINMSEKEFTANFILKFPTLSSDLWVLYRGTQKADGIAVQQ